jgi:hypothetical protein
MVGPKGAKKVVALVAGMVVSWGGSKAAQRVVWLAGQWVVCWVGYWDNLMDESSAETKVAMRGDSKAGHWGATTAADWAWWRVDWRDDRSDGYSAASWGGCWVANWVALTDELMVDMSVVRLVDTRDERLVDRSADWMVVRTALPKAGCWETHSAASKDPRWAAVTD